MNLYEIRTEIEAIMSQADENGEMPEGAFDRLAELGITEADKVENLGLMVKNLTAEAEAIKTESDNLTKRRRTVENRVESIKTYLTDYLLMTGQKVKTPRLMLSLRPSVAVVVDEWSRLDEEYLTYQEPKVDKTMLRRDLIDGRIIEGAHLETRQNLQVK